MVNMEMSTCFHRHLCRSKAQHNKDEGEVEQAPTSCSLPNYLSVHQLPDLAHLHLCLQAQLLPPQGPQRVIKGVRHLVDFIPQPGCLLLKLQV